MAGILFAEPLGLCSIDPKPVVLPRAFKTFPDSQASVRRAGNLHNPGGIFENENKSLLFRGGGHVIWPPARMELWVI